MQRIMGLILMVISIEFVLKGGKNNFTITDKNMNNWINEQPQYIFKGGRC